MWRTSGSVHIYATSSGSLSSCCPLASDLLTGFSQAIYESPIKGSLVILPNIICAGKRKLGGQTDRLLSFYRQMKWKHVNWCFDQRKITNELLLGEIWMHDQTKGSLQ